MYNGHDAMMMTASERERGAPHRQEKKPTFHVRGANSSRADRCVKSFKSPDQIRSFFPYDRRNDEMHKNAREATKEREKAYLQISVTSTTKQQNNNQLPNIQF